MMNRLIFLMTFCMLVTMVDAQLKTAWVTEAKFEVPESVKFCQDENCIFVSNISGKPADKDGIGFISKLSAEGRIICLKWVEGLDAPKGMAVCNNILYVSNIDELILINIKKAEIIKRIHQPNAKFLNDVTITHNNDVLVSDTRAACIYVLNEDKLDIWLEDEAINGVNGLFAEDNYVLVGTANNILKVDPLSKQFSVFVETTGQIDGFEPDGNGGYYYSYWHGELYHVIPPHKPVKLLDTQKDNIQSADIGFNKERKEVLVPTFFSNQVVAYTRY